MRIRFANTQMWTDDQNLLENYSIKWNSTWWHLIAFYHCLPNRFVPFVRMKNEIASWICGKTFAFYGAVQCTHTHTRTIFVHKMSSTNFLKFIVAVCASTGSKFLLSSHRTAYTTKYLLHYNCLQIQVLHRIVHWFISGQSGMCPVPVICHYH